MDNRLLRFIVFMTFAAVLVWIGGEVLIVAVLKLGTKPSIVWTIFMFGSLIAVNIGKALKDDDDDGNNRNW